MFQSTAGTAYDVERPSLCTAHPKVTAMTYRAPVGEIAFSLRHAAGFAAASGIALIHSVANLGGFAGPYAIGIVSQKTGSLFGGLALTGVSLFVCATLASFLPKSSLGRNG